MLDGTERLLRQLDRARHEAERNRARAADAFEVDADAVAAWFQRQVLPAMETSDPRGTA